MPRKTSAYVRGLGLALLAYTLLLPVGAHAALGEAHVEIIGVDTSRQPKVEITLDVRDANGRGVANLGADAFTIEEQGRTVPGELITAAPGNEQLHPPTLAIVADTSTLLGAQATAAIREDASTLIRQLADADRSAAVALFVPRSGATAATQPLDVLPFTTDRAAALQALNGVANRAGQTDLYNAVVAAINASADEAAQRGGPAYVAVLSDGLDRTSIVGTGQSGANEAARIAEERHVRVLTFGYGDALQRGSPLLTQLADRGSGTYQPNPDSGVLTQLAAQLRAEANGGSYTLRFTSALPADGAEHPLAVQVRLNDHTLAADTQALMPRPWDTAAPQQLDVQLDAQAYPNIALWTRPVNRLRHTVPNLVASDVQLLLDGKPIDAPVQIISAPLDARDPAAAQTVALVVDQGGSNAATLRTSAATWLQTPSDTPSRVALFVPGVAAAQPQFTHDHNAVINALNASIGKGSTGDFGATLLQAIDAAARDGDAAKRPAYVVLFADAPLAPGARARATTLARSLGVTVETIALTAEVDQAIAPLADATIGTHIIAPDTAALRAIAQRIEQDRATHYRIAVTAPMVADGAKRSLALAVRGKQLAMPLTPFVAGEAAIRPPVSAAGMALAFGAVVLALAGAALLPRAIQNRRLRCPTCSKVRRASWGDTCLFCERAAVERAATPGTDVPLSGFALAGAALLRDIPRITPLPAAEAQPAAPDVAAQPAADQARVQTHTDFWGPLPPEPVAAQDYAFEQPSAVQAHTDFWGPLPTTEQIAVPAAPSTPASAAPEAPIVTREPVVAPALTPEIDQAYDFAAEHGAPTHTDFWGPLPATVHKPAAPEAHAAPDVPSTPASDMLPEQLPPKSDALNVPQRTLALTNPAPPSGNDQSSDTAFWGPVDERSVKREA